jgi:uroporphyrinogen III methyltransferase / synthase
VASGIVYLVGAGPGHPGLLTVRGLRLLERCDVVVYDALADDRILLGVPAAAERVFVGKRGGAEGTPQEEINRLLVDRASSGKKVVRLKGGDPFVFGRGGEEAEALASAGIRFEVVPGVTAGIAGPAYAGIPVTHRDVASEVLLGTGRGASPRWADTLDAKSIAAARGTVVLYMALANLKELATQVIRAGRDPSTPVAAIEWATHARQRVVTGTLATIGTEVEASRLQAPVVTIIGEVVRLREKLAWAERRPLFGRTIVVTRARHQAEGLTASLEELGAEVIELPAIEILPPENWAPFDSALRSLETYDWVVITSANGVEHFFARLAALGMDARALAKRRIAAVGSATANALRAAHLIPDAMPSEFNAAALANTLAATGVAGKRFLVVRALEGREVLPEELRKGGATVDVVAAYRTGRPDVDISPLRARLQAGRVQMVTFASSSAVRNYLDMFAEGEAVSLHRDVAIAVIGPVTEQAAVDAGLKVALRPREATAAALVEAIVSYFVQQKAGT